MSSGEGLVSGMLNLGPRGTRFESFNHQFKWLIEHIDRVLTNRTLTRAYFLQLCREGFFWGGGDLQKSRFPTFLGKIIQKNIN